MGKDFGQTAMSDDEFLPEQEDLELRIRSELDASLTISTKADGKLRHNEEVGGTVFKYDLPVENLPIEFRSMKALAAVNEEESATPT